MNAIDDVNNIVSTMDDADRRLLGLRGKEYQTPEENQKVVKRFIKRIDGVPVSFIDLTGDSTGIAVTIGTRSGDRYRNKGYAKSVAKEAEKWLVEHRGEFDQVVWWCRKENSASMKIAEDIGFNLDESSVIPDDPWIKYRYEKKMSSQKQW